MSTLSAPPKEAGNEKNTMTDTRPGRKQGNPLAPGMVQRMKTLHLDGLSDKAVSRMVGVNANTVAKYRKLHNWSQDRAALAERDRQRLLDGETETGVRRVKDIDRIMDRMISSIKSRKTIVWNAAEFRQLLAMRAAILEREKGQCPFDSYEELCRAIDSLKPGDVERLRRGQKLRPEAVLAPLDGGNGDSEPATLDEWMEQVDGDDKLLKDTTMNEEVDEPVHTDEEEETPPTPQDHPADPTPHSLGPPAP